jgi:hypothetical protein
MAVIDASYLPQRGELLWGNVFLFGVYTALIHPTLSGAFARRYRLNGLFYWEHVTLFQRNLEACKSVPRGQPISGV